jgi:hypothetical protein
MGIEVEDTGDQFVDAGLVQPAFEARSDMAILLGYDSSFFMRWRASAEACGTCETSSPVV